MGDMVTVISVFVAILSLSFAGLTYMRGGKQVAQGEAADKAELMTKLELVGDDVKDIKADNRRRDTDLREMRESHHREIGEVRDIALHAQERADAAHNRLDRAGIDTAD